MNMMVKRKVLSLIDLCIRTDIDLLEHILPHCTVDQLMHVEKCSEERDLSPVTDVLWKKFYEKEFGSKSANLVVERMKHNKVSFQWRQLYEAKLKDMDEAQQRSLDRITQLYKKKNGNKAGKFSFAQRFHQAVKEAFLEWTTQQFVQFEEQLMKKSKIDYLNSREVKNLAAMKKNSSQKNHSVSPMMKAGSFSKKDTASTSKLTKPTHRRF